MTPFPPPRPHPRHHPSLRSPYPPSARPQVTTLADLPRQRRLGGRPQSHNPSAMPLPLVCLSPSRPTAKDTRRPPECRQPHIEGWTTPPKPDGVQEPQLWLISTSCLTLNGIFAHRVSYVRSSRTVETSAYLSPTPSPASPPRIHERTPIRVSVDEAKIPEYVLSLSFIFLRPKSSSLQAVFHSPPHAIPEFSNHASLPHQTLFCESFTP